MKITSKRINNGFVLIEMLCYLFLSSVILLITIPILVDTVSSYIESRDKSIDFNKSEEFFIELEKSIARGNGDVAVDNNKIKINYKIDDVERIDVIVLEGNIIKVYYYEKNKDNFIIKTAVSNMITEINEAKFIRKKDLLYVFINRNEEEFINVFKVKD